MLVKFRESAVTEDHDLQFNARHGVERLTRIREHHKIHQT